MKLFWKKSPVDSFSDESKEMVACANDIASDLGYERISTLHFFLANCHLNPEHSLFSFAFRDPSEYEKFYESNRLGDAVISLLEINKLTIEAEICLREAYKLWKQFYADEQVQAWHIFLAASKDNESDFSLKIPFTGHLEKALENFYKEQGLLTLKLKKSFWRRMFDR